jgi:hypothetical protein
MLLGRGGTIVNAASSLEGNVLIDGERIAAVGPHTHFDLPVGPSARPRHHDRDRPRRRRAGERGRRPPDLARERRAVR